MSNQKSDYGTYSNFDLWILYLFKHFLEESHKDAVDQRITNVAINNNTLEILQSTYLFIDCSVTSNRCVNVTKVAFDFCCVNVLENLFASPWNKFEM